MPPNVESTFQDAVDRQEIPGAILCVSDINDTVSYQKTFGFVSPEPDAAKFPPDLLIWAASCTKLLTSVAFMKAAELGLIKVDDTVDAVLPELASPRIVSSAEDGSFSYVPAQNKITYAHLLTHTSGLTYDFLDPIIMEWGKQNLPADPPSVPEKFGHPLRYEPGTNWGYSCAIDWAGLAIERASGSDLETFFRKHLFDPVGVVENGITFFPQRATGAQVASMSERDPESGKLRLGGMKPSNKLQDEHCWGGQGAYMQAPEYMKMLKSLLADDGKILKSESVKELFRSRFDETLRGKIKEVMFSNPFFIRAMARGMTPTDDVEFCLAGVIDASGKDGWRGKGTVMWGGACNPIWFVDREKGMCGFLGLQVLPLGDPICTQLKDKFEEGVHELAGKV